MQLRTLLWLVFAGVRALKIPLGPNIDRKVLARALDRAGKLNDGDVIFKKHFRERLGCGCAAGEQETYDALFDAMTGGGGPTVRVERLTQWRSDEASFVKAVVSARFVVLAIETAFNALQTAVYYVIFLSGAARELLGHELLPSRGAVDPIDAAAGVAVAFCAAAATTTALRQEEYE